MTGAVNDSDTRASPATAVSPVGTPGSVRGATETELDSAPLPSALTARTFNSYNVPLVSPVITIGDVVNGGVKVTQASEST